MVNEYFESVILFLVALQSFVIWIEIMENRRQKKYAKWLEEQALYWAKEAS